MGCDIHYVIEQKSPNHGWFGIMATDAADAPRYDERKNFPLWKFKPRDYKFFNLLAGVRSYGDDDEENVPIGLPPDASRMTLHYVDFWEGDGHSHSHCSLHDFAVAKMKADPALTAQAASAKLEGKNPVEEFLCTNRLDIADLGGIDAFRVCFWFDN